MFYGVCPYTSKMRSQSKLESDGWDSSHSIVVSGTLAYAQPQ